MTKIIGAFHDYAKSPATYNFIHRNDKLASPHVSIPDYVQALEVAL